MSEVTTEVTPVEQPAQKPIPTEVQTLIETRVGNEKKSLVVAIFLCLFLGGFGAHHFYLENKKKGLWYLAAFIIGWLTSAMGIGFFIIGIIGIFCIIDLFTMSKTITKLMDDRRAELEATYRATGHV